MASSNSYSFNPQLWELTDEAFDRIKIDPASLVDRHIRSARMSWNLLFIHWANLGRKEWKSGLGSHTTTPGEVSWTLPTRVTDIDSVTLMRGGGETPVQNIGRDKYRQIYSKTVRGRPSVYFIDKQTPAAVVYYWNAAENSTDEFKYTEFTRIEDVLTQQEHLGVPYLWLEAAIAGVAAKLAEKFAPELLADKMALAGEAFRAAHFSDDDNADLTIEVRSG